MDIEKLKNIFKEHVEKYDINNINISRKLYHSYRVMDLSILLAKHNNLSDRDIEIATLVGLLHDYARFEQWNKYNTYDDLKSIDHGDLAVEKLFDDNEILKYCDNIDYYDEIYDAIKYHNKYSYPSYLSDENKLFCRIIRDADKLDIFYLLGINKDLLVDDGNISEKVKEKFYNNELINRIDVNNGSDNIILSLAMVFDLEFDYSFKYLHDMKLINKIFDSLDNKVKYEPYFEYIYRYIDKKVNKN